jgi:hypothetical protein
MVGVWHGWHGWEAVQGSDEDGREMVELGVFVLQVGAGSGDFEGRL